MNIENENAPCPDDADATGSDDPQWLEACRREEAIRELLGRSAGDRLRTSDVEHVALDLGISCYSACNFGSDAQLVQR